MEDSVVIVHDRVMSRHPELDRESIMAAWRNRVCCQVRLGPWPPQYVAAGFDQAGRPIEMVTVYDPERDTVLIFHANTPISENVRRELGIARR